MDAKPTCYEMRIDRSFSLFQINVISNEHFTVIEDTAVTEEFVCNNNSDCEDIKLEPYEIYDQVKCKYCGKVFNNKKSLAIYFINHVSFVFLYVNFVILC